MKRLIAIIVAFLGLSANAKAGSETEFVLDYQQMIHLDAEDLAEAGIKNAYEKLKPVLKKYVASPVEVVENINNDLPSYSVTCLGATYEIYSPASDEYEAWGIATYALFRIVNSQLANSDIKFYAINSGNDLGGMFLTPQQVLAAKRTLKRKTDWPYLPSLESEWFGQYH